VLLSLPFGVDMSSVCPLFDFCHFIVLAVTWTPADVWFVCWFAGLLGPEANGASRLESMSSGRILAAFGRKTPLTPVDHRDVFWLVEPFSSLRRGGRREPRLLLRLGVVLRDRQGRHHRGRGLGLLNVQVSYLLGEYAVPTQQTCRWTGSPARAHPVPTFCPQMPEFSAGERT
jgi:hypothetical protein